MRTDDLHLHVRGESTYVDDLPSPAGCLVALPVGSPEAHGRITKLDVGGALGGSEVVTVLTAADIPGQNQIGAIIQDEPLLAAEEVHHVGQPVALVLAESLAAARAARKQVVLEIDPLPAVLDPREAAAQGQLLQPARTFAIGDVDAAWESCAVVAEGRVETGAQEHFYLETQSALAVPQEDRTLLVHSSTQGPTAVQKAVSLALDVPMHAVEVDVRRLGGAFGGKEDQATPWACLAALGADHTRRPVRLVLDRADDVVMTGKRHPYSSDFRIGLDGDGKVLAYEVTYYQNAGAAADLSTAILERSLFHSTGSYHVPNVKATAFSCRTNITPNTAFRGFGGPQAMFVIEAALEKGARALGKPLHQVQRANLLNEGDVFPYGMHTEDCKAIRCWEEADAVFGFADLTAAAARHNAAHAGTKKGVAVMPVCFGISFTNTALNQARALVHVYHDGSVNVSTGAVEMGQGVNRKMRSIVAGVFGIDTGRIRLDTTNTGRVANTSPTAASTGSDLNGAAAKLAAEMVCARLLQVAAKKLDADTGELAIAGGIVVRDGAPTELGWDELVQAAYWSRTDLSAHAHFATPDLHFDKTSEKGRPFAYHVYGTAVTEVTVDCLRGTYRVDAVRLVHDLGRSIDLATDRGQIEGGLVQGIGWLTLEESDHDSEGRLRHDTASKYKVPDFDSVPNVMDVRLLEDPNGRAVLGSKAVGEPPFMYGIGAWFALWDALRAAKPDLNAVHTAPLTPERMLLLLAGEED
ncbi:MAG: molybdopterin-dependent oxidoreductase [bacterium]|nr:molybdopterin-dependent oxidoreductase [bacterium]